MPRPSEGYAVAVASAALGAHDVIIAIAPGDMRPFRHAIHPLPDPLRIANRRFRQRIVLHDRDRPAIVIPGLPIDGDDPFSTVIVVENRGVIAHGVDIDRLAPWTANLRGGDQIVIDIKIAAIHGVHDAVNHVKELVGFTPGETRRPDTFGGAQFAQIQRLRIVEHMGA